MWESSPYIVPDSLPKPDPILLWLEEKRREKKLVHSHIGVAVSKSRSSSYTIKAGIHNSFTFSGNFFHMKKVEDDSHYKQYIVSLE